MVQKQIERRPAPKQEQQGSPEHPEMSWEQVEASLEKERADQEELAQAEAPLEQAAQAEAEELTKEAKAEAEPPITEERVNELAQGIINGEYSDEGVDAELEAYEKAQSRSALGKLRDWIFKTKTGRASLAAFGAFRVFTALGGQEYVSEKGAEMIGDREAAQEMRMEIQDLPEVDFRLDGDTMEPDEDQENLADALITEAVQARSQNGGMFNLIARTCAEGTLEIDGQETTVLDAEKTMHLYGGQLEGIAHMRLRGEFTDIVAEGGGRTALETNTIGDIVQDTMIRSHGGSGVTGIEFLGADRFQGHFSEEELSGMYDKVYDGQVELLTGMMHSVDYGNLDAEAQGQMDQIMLAAASEYTQASVTAMEVGLRVSLATPGIDAEQVIFEGFQDRSGEQQDGLLQQYEDHADNFQEVMQGFDSWSQQYAGDTWSEAEFGMKATDFERQMDGYIADIMDSKAEALGSLGGGDDWSERAENMRPTEFTGEEPFKVADK